MAMESLSMVYEEDGDSREFVHTWHVQKMPEEKDHGLPEKNGSNWNDCQRYSSPEKSEEETQPNCDGNVYSTQEHRLIHLE